MEILPDQIMNVIETTPCETENIRADFLKRLREGALTREENKESHFCVYFLPYRARDKKVFIGHHKKSGLWLSPGGHIEPGEGLLETLDREMAEELGVKNFFHDAPSPFLLTITHIQSDARPCRTHFDIWYLMPTDGARFAVDPTEFYVTQWLTLDEAERLVTDPANRHALETVRRGLTQLKMKVAVGSTNPVKIEAARAAFAALWPEQKWEVVGLAVDSGVATQPMSDEESIRGATNRAREARAAADADFGVGLEGGLHQIGARWFDCGWVVVADREGREGVGSTAKIPTPPKMIALVNQGMELGEANDICFGTTDSKRAEGHFGLMTKNVITRAQGYRDGVVMALTRFVHPHFFEDVF